MPKDLALLIADVYEAAGRLRAHGQEVASTVGQTQARWQAMAVIARGDLTVPQAARRLGISRQALQRTVNELLTDGLFELRPNPAHKSSPLIAITPDGLTTLRAITRRAETFEAGLNPLLSQAEIEQARQVLTKLNRHLAKYDSSSQ